VLAEKYFYDACSVTPRLLQACAAKPVGVTNPARSTKREGNKKDPANWALADSRTSWIIDRGYTAHEHLDNAGLINMNGRLYDPQLGRMLNADPFTSPGTQGMNRYSYVLNNPLKYTDPSGYHAATFYYDSGSGGIGNGVYFDIRGNYSGSG